MAFYKRGSYVATFPNKTKFNPKEKNPFSDQQNSYILKLINIMITTKKKH